MPTIVIQLDPTQLDNPDADLRYRLPDLLVERSNGLIQDDAYDYLGDKPLMAVFLETTDVARSLVHVLDVINNVRLLENDLRKGTAIGVLQEGRYVVVYPPDFAGEFLVTANDDFLRFRPSP